MKAKEREAILIADLGYGDAGKGSIVDYLTRLHGAHTVVRYNGGAQAAHNVIDPDGKHHTFAQFGSGTFVPGTRTHLSRFMLLNPLNMISEERALQGLGTTDAFSRTSVERRALIITPFQQAANRLKEIFRDGGRHGSCGMGIGETMADYLSFGDRVLFAGDLDDRMTTVKKLQFIQAAKFDQLKDVLARIPRTEAAVRELQVFEDPDLIECCADVYDYWCRQVRLVDETYLGYLTREPGTVIFEGAQGILLDEWHGFHPYTTWSTITFENADRLLKEADYQGRTTRLGLVRAYATRHGAGPFVTEDQELASTIPDMHNGKNNWQQDFRVGFLDLVATRYALEIAGSVDGLVVTNIDRLKDVPEWKICEAYDSCADWNGLSLCFDLEGALIKRIKPDESHDLEYQSLITKGLFSAKPIYRPFIPGNSGNGFLAEEDVREYLSLLEKELGIPVAITSYGPTANDKIIPKRGGLGAYIRSNEVRVMNRTNAVYGNG